VEREPKFIGRELSWLQFNKRVLEESVDEDNPIIEQLKFLGIFTSNLDEYFMIRVAGMKGQVDIGLTEPDNKTGFYPREYLNKMIKKSKNLTDYQYQIYHKKIEELQKFITITKYADFSQKSKSKITNYFKNLVFPVLTPITFSPHLPFPILSNLNVHLMIKLEDELGKIQYSLVTVPNNLERLVHVKKKRYVFLEDIIANHIHYLYEGLKAIEIVPFRITRDFDIEFDDHSDDFASSVMNELKNRKRGDAVRLEIVDTVSEDVLNFLQSKLNLSKKFTFLINGPIDLRFLIDMYERMKNKLPHLVFEPIAPIMHKSFSTNDQVIDLIRKKDIILFHPHHSYDPVIRMVEEASSDPNVVAIKQTIYRTTKESLIMKSLLKAAESGKQVTILFELRARFDEENNLFWGNQLERAGAHVIYGVPSLKTHSKLLLVVRRTENAVERFVHFGTGNYNENNAKIYTDISYFTSKKMIATDATKFFNYISSFSKKPSYQKFIASPYGIRNQLIGLIDKEISYQKKEKNGHIIMKMNAITDIPIMEKLYEASNAGVKIDLIVRGICCINPGVPNQSENIHVRSIVGRYLEHMRMYYFHHNGKEELLISSADTMTRNMEKRIELALPIKDVTSKRRCIKLLQLQLQDTVKARVNNKGHYDYVKDADEEINSQIMLYDMIR
jgi:polyphosphate kinase